MEMLDVFLKKFASNKIPYFVWMLRVRDTLTSGRQSDSPPGDFLCWGAGWTSHYLHNVDPHNCSDRGETERIFSLISLAQTDGPYVGARDVSRDKEGRRLDN